MYMFRHNHITENMEDIPSAYLLQHSHEEIASWGGVQIRKPAMATEGEEMKISGVLKSFKPVGHSEDILLPP
jgi:hypothetical protein